MNNQLEEISQIFPLACILCHAPNTCHVSGFENGKLTKAWWRCTTCKKEYGYQVTCVNNQLSYKMSFTRDYKPTINQVNDFMDNSNEITNITKINTKRLTGFEVISSEGINGDGI